MPIRVQVQRPERLPSGRVGRHERAAVLAVEDQPRGRCQRASLGVGNAEFRNLPFHRAGLQIDGAEQASRAGRRIHPLRASKK